MPTETHRWVIDGLEEQVAAVEVDGGATVRLPRWMLPRGAKQGDVLTVRHALEADGGASTLHIALDPGETTRARRKSQAQVEAPVRPSKGDITL